jgi:hypothetical protein
LVEQLIRNQQVIGSSPIAGSKFLRQQSPDHKQDSSAEENDLYRETCRRDCENVVAK